MKKMWKFTRKKDDSGARIKVDIEDSDGKYIGFLYNISEEDEKFIDVAVNSHDELMEANDILGMAEAKSREKLDEAVEMLKDSEKYSEHIKSCVLNSRSELKPCDCGRANWIERKSQLLAKMKEV